MFHYDTNAHQYCFVPTDDLIQGGRPAPYMLFKNMINLEITNVKTCIKVDDSAPGIFEGHNAGMWTVGLLLSGNEAGLTLEEFNSADEATLIAARAKARCRFASSEPHFLIDTIDDLPSVITEVERRISVGERP